MTTVTRRRSFPPRVVHCRSCGASIGQAFGERIPAVYCLDPVCPRVPPTNFTEERDGLILLLRHEQHFSKDDLAALMGLSRQRIIQILEAGFYAPAPVSQRGASA